MERVKSIPKSCQAATGNIERELGIFNAFVSNGTPAIPGH